jgi:hypothetical protein
LEWSRRRGDKEKRRQGEEETRRRGDKEKRRQGEVDRKRMDLFSLALLFSLTPLLLVSSFLSAVMG